MRIVMSKSGCKSARGIASIIGCPSRYRLPKNRKVFIVPYGSDIPNANLNAKLVKDKKQALLMLKEKGLPIPRVIEKNEVISLSDNDFPILGRKSFHTKGRDVVVIKSKGDIDTRSDYYLKYIPKWSEYRVHVFDGVAEVVAAKTHDNKDVAKKNPVWNEDSGWKQYTYTGEHLDKLKKLGEDAIKALGYDFGAVDIIRRDKEFYILEVNSAPGLIPERQKVYADYFIRKEKEWKARGRV